jgi:NAD+ diphosphatase
VSLLPYERFIPENVESAPRPGASHWFIIQGDKILARRQGEAVHVPLIPDVSELGLAAERAHYLGTIDGLPCRTAEVPLTAAAPAGWSFDGLRSFFGAISDVFFTVAARALEMCEWDRSHRFCGSCGTATIVKADERARECPQCASLSYPRISPAVIMAITRGRKILLARARRFPPGFFSVLAGFVEPGETLEQCVSREVMEEAGIALKNIRYFASQPWPFPHSLMIAFTAEHAGGEIHVDTSELVEADWYSADALPSIPDRMTVARRLIDWFCAQ